MLFALIPIAWLFLLGLCWAVCMMAQRGDVEPEPVMNAYRGVHRTSDEPVAWKDLPELSSQDARLIAHGVR